MGVRVRSLFFGSIGSGDAAPGLTNPGPLISAFVANRTNVSGFPYKSLNTWNLAVPIVTSPVSAPVASSP